MMKLCKCCMEAIKSHGEPILTYTTLVAAGYLMDAEESKERDIPCAWCDEYDDLYECLLD